MNVETAENLERIFDKEKTNVFNLRKSMVTSTPNVNNTKKVAFDSDITMIPQKDAANKQVESVEKLNSKKKAADKSSNSKRKADSMSDKSDSSSRSKKAKLAETPPEEEVAKENLNEINNEMESDKQPIDKPVDKQTSGRKSATLQNKEIDGNQEKKSSQPTKQSDEQAKQTEEENKQIEEQIKRLEEENRKIEDQYKQLVEKNRQMNDQNEHLVDQYKQIEISCEQLEEKNRQLDEKIRLLEAKQDFEQRSIQLIKEQITGQMKEQTKELTTELMKEVHNIMNVERIQEMVIVGLTRIVSNTETAIASSIEFDKIGKVNFTIEPFKAVVKPTKEMRNLEIQTDEIKIPTGEFYVQTEPPSIVNQSSNTDANQIVNQPNEKTRKKSTSIDDKEIREVVNNVIDECNGNRMTNGNEGKDGNRLTNGNEGKASDYIKPTNTPNGNKSNNNFSIQFDDSVSKETKEIAVANKMNGDAEEKLDSDELKKHVENDSIFDDSDDEIDELPPSSPIYDM